MEKSIVYTSILTAAALTITGTTIYLGANSNETASAKSDEASAQVALTTTNNLVSTKPLSTSKDETVYIISDAAGATTKTFIGNQLYQGDENLPFNFHITYYLDGEEISANDLKGKSGHVKIVYSYDPVATFGGKYVPFLAITGVSLDSAKFSNVELDSGKTMMKDGTTLAIGYAFPGVSDDLGTDILPSRFTIEADVTNFELSTGYTVLTNSIFGELDTSKLSDLDSLANSMNDLSAGLDQIISGTSDLKTGLEQAVDGVKQLFAGSETLADGLTELTAYNDDLISGATATFNIFLKQASTATGQELTIENYDETLTNLIAYLASLGMDTTELETLKTSLDSYNTFYTGLASYAAGVSQAAAGATALSKNLGALVSGETALYEGSVKLKDGLDTFKQTGIDKLVNFANNDLASFTRNARATVNAAKSYTNFNNQSAESVKFIIKTPGI